MPEPPRSTDDSKRVVSDLTKSETIVSEGYAPQEIREDRALRFFVSYAHLDGKLKEDLLARLLIRLKSHKSLRFEHWSDQDILVGTDWFAAIQRAMEACDFAVLLVSPEFLSREFIRETELPWLYANKAVIPVAVRPLSTNLDWRGLEAKQIFFHNGKSYIDKVTDRTRGQFVDALFDALCLRLKSAPQAQCEPPTAPVKQRRDFDHFRLSVSDVDLKTFAPTEGQETSLHKGLEPGPAIDARLRKDAIAFLTEWVGDKDGPPYAVLLGETGLGKTTTCKVFANRLFGRREKEASVPLPIYFDLRHVGGRGRNLVLEEIVDLILRESWKGGPGQARLAPAEIFDLVAAEPTLVIWDGLDEVLVHLDDNEGQRFTRQLFRILPPRSKGDRRVGRMLVTCRTHYFRTLRDQQTHLRGEDRDNIRLEDYRDPFLLLPFTEVQIKTYLKATLPDRDPDGVMQVIAGVHNLTEMAERPYTLSLIVREFETIERWKAEGRQVTGVTLYRHMVRSWLERDAGKHQIQPDHKQLIMEHLAAELWRSGQRYWKVANLEEWLLDFFEANAKVERHYRGKGLEQLKEDLRTATFLVRDGEDQFRFAHTSLQEFFLAGYLRRALIDGQPERWAMSPVSNETLDFLGQWLLEEAGETRAAALGTLGRIRDEYTPTASENVLRYCLGAKRYPCPSMEGFQLPGARLDEMEFEGEPDAPLRLDRINLAGARLWNTRWRHCRLSGGDLSGADVTGAEFLHCAMEGSRWQSSILEATTFRDCDLRGVSFGGVPGRKSRWLRCDVTDAELPGDALVALNRPEGAAHLSGDYELWVASGHGRAVVSCAWSPDGRRIVSASVDNTLRIWDAESGQSVRALRGHDDSVTGCAWSPDGRRIVSASADKTVRIWDAVSGQSLRTLNGHEDWVRGCAWSPNGRRIVSASDDNTLRVWDAESGLSLSTLTGHDDSVLGCAWSTDRRRIVSSSTDNTLRIWDAESGQSLRTLNGHEDSVSGCAWSPDGGRIVSASEDHTLRIWDAQTGQSLRTLNGHDRYVLSCGWSPEGGQIVSASTDNTLRVWDADSGRCLRSLRGHRDSAKGCAWSPDGRRIVSASDDQTLRIWNAESGQSLRTLSGGDAAVLGCAWSPDGRRIVSASADHTLRIWDAESGHSLRTLSGHEDWVWGCAWSPDGRLVASTSEDGTVRLWDPDAGCELDRRIYLRSTPYGSVWATIDHSNNRILACHPEAWRILGWRDVGAGGMAAILPAETFGPLP